MHTFEEGQKVRAIRETESLHETHYAGTVFFVGRDRYRVLDGPEEFIGGPSGKSNQFILQTEDFELVLDPAKVEVGDTVRLEREDGTLIQAKVFQVDPVDVTPPERTLRLYGIPEWVLIGKDSYTLTAHQPAPKVEWEPETIVRATVNGVPNTLLMRLAPGYEGGFVWATPKLTPRRPENAQSWLLYEDADITDIRPLVMIEQSRLDVHELAIHNGLHNDGVRRLLADIGIKNPGKADN